jgi:cytochrome b561
MDETTLPGHTMALPAPRRFDPVTISVHWLTLLLMIVMFVSVWMREQASDGATAELLLTSHRSAGMLLWCLTLLRLIWKATRARRPAFPDTMARPMRWMALANEVLLYLLLVVQPATGILHSIARGKPFAIFGLTVPAFMARDKDLAHLSHTIHENGANVLLVLIAMHAGAGLFHALVLRDGVLGTMLPWQAARQKI